MNNQPKLSFACVYPNEVPVSFMNSWTNFLMFDLQNWGALANDHAIISVRYGTDGIVAARNTVVEQFLASDNDWLLWVDADMGFDPMGVYKLLSIADPELRPIVGGLCFASREYDHDGLNGYRTKPSPTIFQPVQVNGVQDVAGGKMYPVNTLVRCSATGSAFILIHRGVFEKIGSGWYDRIPNADGKLKGEDVSFCLRAGEAGIPVHVFTGAKTSHFKPQWVSEADYWKAIVVPPATDEVAVIVPVLQRPENARPFMQSVKASTGLAHVYAVADHEDTETIAAWERAGATVLLTAQDSLNEPTRLLRTFSKKVNFGYEMTKEPWIFITGDDVIFRPGWLDHAQHIAKTWKASVVGTNDLGNSRVTSGEHATHLLISRSYIDEQGASWDGPKVVAHDGYRHWFVDDEIVAVAKQRNVWSMALGAVVEHFHPIWKKAEDDEVYRLGRSFAEDDEGVFKRRCARYQPDMVS